MERKGLILLSVLICLVAVSCDFYTPGYDSSYLRVSGMSPRPDLTWKCTITGPDGKISGKTAERIDFLFESLTPGTYGIYLEGTDRNGFPYSWQSAEVTLKKGKGEDYQVLNVRWKYYQIEKQPKDTENVLFRVSRELDGATYRWVVYPKGSTEYQFLYVHDGESLVLATVPELDEMFLEDGRDAWELRWSFDKLECIVTLEGKQKVLSIDPRDSVSGENWFGISLF